ncbi:ABC transporter substrate-binding protein [Bifidobacterium xylocopae]|nr:ABC transporter substrate-binding protein [Bifidobacterium xylocopae]
MVLGSAGCGAGSSSGADGKTDPKALTQETIQPGTLTIATDNPCYTPWFIDNKPESGQGFESAMAYAVSAKMGFPKDKVRWTRTTYASAIAPGSKQFDMNIQEFTISPERRNAVDFSSEYYKPTLAVLVRGDSKYAQAKSISDLKGAAIGATVASDAYVFAKRRIKDDIKVFDDNVALAQAVDSKQIDALVISTVIAVNMRKTHQVTDGKVVGQLAGSTNENGIGIVLPKGSKLTKAASKAVDELRRDGTVRRLQDRWLKEYTTDVPVIH